MCHSVTYFLFLFFLNVTLTEYEPRVYPSKPWRVRMLYLCIKQTKGRKPRHVWATINPIRRAISSVENWEYCIKQAISKASYYVSKPGGLLASWENSDHAFSSWFYRAIRGRATTMPFCRWSTAPTYTPTAATSTIYSAGGRKGFTQIFIYWTQHFNDVNICLLLLREGWKFKTNQQNVLPPLPY